MDASGKKKMLIGTKKISFVLGNIWCECVVSKRLEERKKKKKSCGRFFLKELKILFLFYFFKLRNTDFFVLCIYFMV